MSTTSKKPKTLSATSLTNLVKKHAKRAHSADKAVSSSRRAQQRNPELNTVSDQQNVLTDPTVTGEVYNSENPVSAEAYNNERNVTAEPYNKERNVTAEGYRFFIK